MRRIAWVALLAAGCSKPGGWHGPVDPPFPGTAALSVFESDTAGTECRWSQVDPVGGGRRPLLTIPEECNDPRVVWSPDGRRAALSNGADSTRIFEVDLTGGAWRELAESPGTVDELFWRDGELYLRATWDDPPSILEKLGLKSGTAAQQTGTLRLDGTRWSASDEEPPDDAWLGPLDSATLTQPLPPELPLPDKKTRDRLTKEFELEEWRELGPKAWVAWSEEGPTEPLVFARPDGSLEEAEGFGTAIFSSNGGRSEDGGPATIVRRDRFLLVTDQGYAPRVYDLAAGKLLYHSEDALASCFWPRP